MAGDLHDAGVVVDPLFVALTRPAMRWGVTFSALLMNLVFTMEAFLLTKNLLTLLIAVPIHGVCALLCLRDPRFFDLIFQWGRTRLPSYLGNARLWRASSCSPLVLDLPNRLGRRRWDAVPRLGHAWLGEHR
ncbi:MAG TPA: VirB3 family type IV secretion system protein [Steroidobacteraceae bacterium]|jgi:type IV secretion system protein VirB3|nr:VirB3 family type IV secretion system protein [Steroidobacteraceae bacterium]